MFTAQHGLFLSFGGSIMDVFSMLRYPHSDFSQIFPGAVIIIKQYQATCAAKSAASFTKIKDGPLAIANNFGEIDQHRI